MRFELTPETDSIEHFLASRGWLQAGESVVSAGPAGKGNMNQTLRVQTDKRSFILKQSYPYCAKFPDIPAPLERIDIEVQFYGIARRSAALAAAMPEVIEYSAGDQLAMIEDLGAGSDLLSLYAGDRLRSGELETLCHLARELHALAITSRERDTLQNRSMRELNHEHIFDIPLRPDNGLDLDAVTPDLSTLAAETRRDTSYVKEVAALGRLYLEASGPCLLHGDYYPGSLLRTKGGLAIIDPEFAFPGPAEFDLGVFVAHLIFAGEEGDAIADRILAAYREPVDRALVEGFAGAELMRRTLGVSQLPLAATLTEKRGWLELSRTWVKCR